MAKKRPKGEAANGRERPSPAYFLSLSLENVRCFGPKQTLDLSDGKGGWARWTVLLGENGAGKTTVLQALAVINCQVAAGPIPEEDGEKGRYSRAYEQSLDRCELFLRSSEAKARMTWSMQAGANVLSGEVEIESEGLCEGHPNVSERTLQPAPCFGYGAGRRPSLTTLIDAADEGDSVTLFGGSADLLNAEEWLLRADYSASKKSKIQYRLQKRVDHIRALLIALLPDVDDIRFTDPIPDQPVPGVEFHTPYGWVPLHHLGYGYQTVVAWVVDLAARLLNRYPDSSDPLGEPVIVLVDEIDLHLHPRWQRQLMSDLDRHFKQAQFIVTAHSPLIVQAAPDANLAVLRREGDHVVIDNDVDNIRNWRVDQILTSELFGLKTARPPHVEPLMARRQALLSKPRLTAADKKEVEELEGRIGPLPIGESPEQKRISDLIERSIELFGKEEPSVP